MYNIHSFLFQLTTDRRQTHRNAILGHIHSGNQFCGIQVNWNIQLNASKNFFL
jgi:hypothetical protein